MRQRVQSPLLSPEAASNTIRFCQQAVQHGVWWVTGLWCGTEQKRWVSTIPDLEKVRGELGLFFNFFTSSQIKNVFSKI